MAWIATLPRVRLVIVGAGHVGQAVASLAAEADFDVWVIDDRGQYANPERFPTAQQILVGPIEEVLAALEVTPHTYALIVTRGHGHDQEALYHLAPTPAPYVGLIGSRRKIKLIFESLRDAGIAEADLARVAAPVGLDIGSQTVPEIAISIVAELIARRSLGPRGLAAPAKCREPVMSSITMTIPAIVPAAGKSRRMGRSKPLLPFDGQPLIGRVVARFAWGRQPGSRGHSTGPSRRRPAHRRGRQGGRGRRDHSRALARRDARIGRDRDRTTRPRRPAQRVHPGARR